MSHQIYKYKRTFIGRLPNGADLLKGITEYIIKHKISIGEVHGIGAVSRSAILYYNQQTKEYEKIAIDEPMEMLSLAGNISIRDHDPYPHLHIVLGDRTGRTFGGRLAGGTIVFAAEIVIREYEGERLYRERDPGTGLHLWDYRSELLV